MNVYPTSIPQILILQPAVFQEERALFPEPFTAKRLDRQNAG